MLLLLLLSAAALALKRRVDDAVSTQGPGGHHHAIWYRSQAGRIWTNSDVPLETAGNSGERKQLALALLDGALASALVPRQTAAIPASSCTLKSAHCKQARPCKVHQHLASATVALGAALGPALGLWASKWTSTWLQRSSAVRRECWVHW